MIVESHILVNFDEAEVSCNKKRFPPPVYNRNRLFERPIPQLPKTHSLIKPVRRNSSPQLSQNTQNVARTSKSNEPIKTPNHPTNDARAVSSPSSSLSAGKIDFIIIFYPSFYHILRLLKNCIEYYATRYRN